MITSHFIELGMAYLLAAMMPGPSVTLIIKNGILYSRAASIQACLGTIIGTALQSGVILPMDRMWVLIINSYLFKLFFTVCSTPLFYICVVVIRSILKNQ
jgi:queuosine precursor transporter